MRRKQLALTNGLASQLTKMLLNCSQASPAATSGRLPFSHPATSLQNCKALWVTHRCSRASKPENASLATDLILFPNRVLQFQNTQRQISSLGRWGEGEGEREREEKKGKKIKRPQLAWLYLMKHPHVRHWKYDLCRLRKPKYAYSLSRLP